MPELFFTTWFLTLSLVSAFLGLALAVLADHLQTIAKYKGALKQQIASGYNFAMKIMVANRLGAVLYFLFIAFNIDNGLSATELATGLAITLLGISLPAVGVLIWLQRTMNANGINQHVMDTSNWPKAIVFATFFATSLNLLGLTVPWIAGAMYPEFRLTLANTSFLFNTLFTLINVFYIEHYFAKIVDEKEADIHGFVSGVMFARLISLFFVSFGLYIAA